jgi:hypothetical protein
MALVEWPLRPPYFAALNKGVLAYAIIHMSMCLVEDNVWLIVWLVVFVEMNL